MCHLCYVYIYQYRNLSNLELCIDPRYEYKFDPKNKKLSIEKSQNVLPEDFWGEGIYSLTGIFGNNGAGKSNSIRFILDAVISGNGYDRSVNGIVVYEKNGELKVYHHNDMDIDEKYHINIISSLVKDPNGELPAIETFYYGGHFNPDISYADMTTVELKGLYNASINCKLIDDFRGYTSIDRSLNLPISTIYEAYKSQNNYRICQLLVDDKLRKIFNNEKDKAIVKLPRYISFAPNRCGYYNFTSELNAEGVGITDIRGIQVKKQRELLRFDKKENTLALFIHHCLLNYLVENRISSLALVEDWYKWLETNKKVLPQFREFVRLQTGLMEIEIPSVILEMLTELDEQVRTNEYGSFYLDFEQDKEKILNLVKSAHDKNIFLTSRHFDLYYSHEPDDGTTLSSGEQALLNLFSLIYDAVIARPQKRSNFTAPQLLVLDEAEIGFHPEWQRNYMSMLVDFVNALSEETGHDFQILITSHSPILLSDIPLCCCNYLKLSDDMKKTENVRDSQRETFASNVFNLYRDCFFLEDGLIGRFAEGKLKKLDEDIKKGSTNEEDIKQRIGLIGDERLRLYYVIALKSSRMQKELLIEEYNKRIKKLEEEIK